MKVVILVHPIIIRKGYLKYKYKYILKLADHVDTLFLYRITWLI